MARTHRNIPRNNCLRRIRTTNQIRNDIAAREEISEYDPRLVSNRLRSIGRIPTSWDDLPIAAWDEIYQETRKGERL